MECAVHEVGPTGSIRAKRSGMEHLSLAHSPITLFVAPTQFLPVYCAHASPYQAKKRRSSSRKTGWNRKKRAVRTVHPHPSLNQCYFTHCAFNDETAAACTHRTLPSARAAEPDGQYTPGRVPALEQLPPGENAPPLPRWQLSTVPSHPHLLHLPAYHRASLGRNGAAREEAMERTDAPRHAAAKSGSLATLPGSPCPCCSSSSGSEWMVRAPSEGSSVDDGGGVMTGCG